MRFLITTFLLVFCSGLAYSSELIDRFGEPARSRPNNSHMFTKEEKHILLWSKSFYLQVLDNDNYKKGFGDTTRASDGKTLGEKRTEVLKSVFTDLDGIIDSKGMVEIEIISVCDSSSGVIGMGSSYYLLEGSGGGFISGAAIKTLCMGKDAYSGTDKEGNYHGYIIINFANKFNLDYDATSFSGYDLYSVILHEAMHVLDFGSSIIPGIANRFTGTPSGFYHWYDNFIYYEKPGGELVKAINSTDCHSVAANPEFKNDYITPGTGRMVFISRYNDTIQLYAPRAWTGGSSLSHENTSAGGPKALMSPSFEQGEYARHPSETELRMLSTLGLKFYNEYGTRFSATRHAKYETTCETVFACDDVLERELTPGEPFKLYLNDLTGNDINSNSACCIDFLDSVPGATLSNHELNSDNADITITLNDELLDNKILLKYRAFGHGGKENYATVKIPAKLRILEDCQNLTGNYVCNGDFENTIGYGDPSLKREDSLYLDGYKDVQAWRGLSFSKFMRNYLYGRISNTGINVSSLIKQCYNISAYGTNYKNWVMKGDTISWQEFIPDTYDKYLQNKHFLGIVWGIGFINTKNGNKNSNKYFIPEFLYQKINIPDKKKYVLEFMAFKNYFYWSDNDDYCLLKQNSYKNKYKDDKILVYLDKENPSIDISKSHDYTKGGCPKFDEGIKMYFGEQILFNDHVPLNKWTHFKSKPFVPDNSVSPERFLMFTGDFRSLPDTTDAQFWFFFDDVIIREAGLGIQSWVNNEYPCLGGEVELTFKVWKDEPEDSSAVTLIDELPAGMEFAGGDFALESGKIICRIGRDRFNDSAIAYVRLKARVKDDILLAGQTLINRVYPQDYSEDRMAGLGKYRCIIKPVRRNIEVTKEIDSNRCNGSDITVRIKLKNLTGKELTKLTLLEKNYNTALKCRDNTEKRIKEHICKSYEYYINGIEHYRSDEEPIFGYYDSNDDFNITGFSLDGLGQDGEKSKELEIMYKLTPMPGADTVLSETTLIQYDEGCGWSSGIDKYDVNPIKLRNPFPKDTTVCGQITLSTGFNGMKHTWNDGAIGASRQITKPGFYKVTITTENGCTLQDSARVKLYPVPEEASVEQDSIRAMPGDFCRPALKLKMPDYINIGDRLEMTYKMKFDKSKLSLAYIAYYKPISDIDGRVTVERKVVLSVNKQDYDSVAGRFVVRSSGDKLKVLSNDYDSTSVEYFDIRFGECNIEADPSRVFVNIAEPGEGLKRVGDAAKLHIGKVYPNPCRESLEFEFSTDIRDKVEISLSDILGRETKSIFSETISAGSYRYTADMSDYADGLYYIIIKQCGARVQKKFIKSR